MTDDFVLSKIKLHNYYLYKGDVVIDFTNNDESKNLFLFIFPNGGGKTSLYHAIKWGFYGNKFKYYKENKEMKPINMVNAYASEKGEGFYVEIEFYLNGDRYRLRRTCEAPRTGADMVELITPTDTLFDIEAKEMLDTIIPSDYGKFFMFDGRDLSSLSEAQDDRGQVDGILKLLGLSSIQIARDKLKGVKAQYELILRQYRSSNDIRSTAAEEYDAFVEEDKRIEDELADNERETREVIGEIESLRSLIEGAKEVKKLTEEKASVREKLAEATTNKNNALEQLSKSRKLIHICLLKDEYSRIIKDNEQELKRLEEVTGLDENSMTGLELSKYIIKKSLTTCPACHQRITPLTYEEIESILEENNKKIEARKENNRKIKECATNKKFFEELLKRDYREAYKALVRYETSCDKITEFNNQIAEIEKQIRRSGVERVETWSNNLIDKEKRLTQLQDEKENIGRRKAVVTRKKDAAYTKMMREPFGDDRIQSMVRRIGFCDGLIEKLDKTVSASISRMREEILKVSNDFFKDMTNKPEIYDRLQYINDDSYLMTIVKKDGRTVPQGSTGELQIVTMSFLMALSKCSGRTTPIVMDTPTTNLDLIHSKGIERSLKSIHNQVLFLAQPAESTENFIEGVKDIIAKKYETEHDEYDNATIKEVAI